MVPAESQAERLAAVKSAARALGVDLVLNARVDVFIHRLGSPVEQLAEGVRRALLYREAGADCIYPIILSDPDMLAKLVAAAGVVNATVRRGGPLSLAAAASAGVRRATYATSLFRETLTMLEGTASEIQTEMSDLP